MMINLARKFLSLRLTVLLEISRQNKCTLNVVGPILNVYNKSYYQLTNKKVHSGFKMGCSTSKVEVSGSVKNEKNEEYVEGVVCSTSDINDNEMKVFDLNDSGKVLLVKQKGKINAIAHKCTHYGAPLVGGALGDGRIRCPWHGACFNIETGDIEDFPGLDALPCYKVTIENDQVKVRAKKSQLADHHLIKTMATKDDREDQHFVIIGGGPAGAVCSETLRQENFTGSITLICKENCLPYDRIKVSKSMDFEIDKAEFRSEEFYKQNGIDVLKGVAATSVDTGNKTVALSDGKRLNYDRLLIATGSKPAKLKIPGADLENIFVLRDYRDAKSVEDRIREDLEVVISGSSFIAMEAASYFVDKVKKTTIVSRSEVPFHNSFGVEIGKAFLKFFQEKGVHFITMNTVEACKKDDSGSNKVSTVELSDGTVLKADMVIMAVGSGFYTDFLKGSGVNLRDDGTVETDEYLSTNVTGVYVGGDIAYAPVFSSDNKKASIGHYPLAHYHGKIAALNMLNKGKPLRAVPFFWTMLFGKGVRYAGHGDYDEIIFDGQVDELKFVAFYLKGDEVVAVSSCARDPVVSQYAELRYQGKKLYRKDVSGGDKFAWVRNILP